jgi:hypothetical protein
MKNFGTKTVMFLAGLAVSASACVATYAPPIRSTHYGSPGRLQKGDWEIGGASTVFPSGGPQASVGITDWLALEVGGDIAQDGLGGGDNSWIMGFAGARFTPLKKSFGSIELALDLELGAGGGVGGVVCLEKRLNEGSEYCSEDDGLEWNDRAAFGGYTGVGFGLTFDFFSVFTRVRAQLTSATNIPMTTWLSEIGGIQFRLWKKVYLYAAGGGVQYFNSEDSKTGTIFEAGLSIKF